MNKQGMLVMLEGDASMIEELEEKGEIQVFKYSCEDDTSMFIEVITKANCDNCAYGECKRKQGIASAGPTQCLRCSANYGFLFVPKDVE